MLYMLTVMLTWFCFTLIASETGRKAGSLASVPWGGKTCSCYIWRCNVSRRLRRWLCCRRIALSWSVVLVVWPIVGPSILILIEVTIVVRVWIIRLKGSVGISGRLVGVCCWISSGLVGVRCWLSGSARTLYWVDATFSKLNQTFWTEAATDTFVGTEYGSVQIVTG